MRRTTSSAGVRRSQRTESSNHRSTARNIVALWRSLACWGGSMSRSGVATALAHGPGEHVPRRAPRRCLKVHRPQVPEGKRSKGLVLKSLGEEFCEGLLFGPGPSARKRSREDSSLSNLLAICAGGGIRTIPIAGALGTYQRPSFDWAANEPRYHRCQSSRCGRYERAQDEVIGRVEANTWLRSRPTSPSGRPDAKTCLRSRPRVAPRGDRE